jgi:hypothetical protein
MIGTRRVTGNHVSVLKRQLKYFPENRVTLEKLKSAIFMAGSCIFQFSLETAPVGAVKASTLLNARKGLALWFPPRFFSIVVEKSARRKDFHIPTS